MPMCYSRKFIIWKIFFGRLFSMKNKDELIAYGIKVA